MHLISLLIFIPLQLLFIPFAILGLILIFYKKIYVSKRLGVSQTAIEVINDRWIMAFFGLRKDDATLVLNRILPNSSIFGLWLVFFPSFIRYKLSGQHYGYPSFPKQEEETILYIVIARTLYIDILINKSKGNVDQFVILGAGLDTRCYGDLSDQPLSFFELDQSKIQQLKKDCLSKTTIDCSNVHFVAVDFTKDGWYDLLEKAGYDPNKKTIFLWEGVSLYLTKENIRHTLKKLKYYAAPGSVLIADFYDERFVNGTYTKGYKLTSKVLEMTGESFKFGLDFTQDKELILAEFLASEGLHLGDTYFIGAKTKKGSYMVVSEILGLGIDIVPP